MGNLVRFSVSIDETLIEKFDSYIDNKGYVNRSEAIRDLIRNILEVRDLSKGSTHSIAVVSFIYNHHQLELPKRLTELQHAYHTTTVSSLHLHLDHERCLEILVLRGPNEKVKKLGEKLVSTKGIEHGKVSLTAI